MELELESILLPGIEEKRPLVIAGPCSAETEEQVMDTAKQLAAKGMKIFRAGIWKPRTKPGGFEGVGVEGLAWLKEVKKETGMYVSTEVATAKHVYECLKAGIDILWVGARTTANPFAVQEIADALKGVDIPAFHQLIYRNTSRPRTQDASMYTTAPKRICIPRPSHPPGTNFPAAMTAAAIRIETATDGMISFHCSIML